MEPKNAPQTLAPNGISIDVRFLFAYDHNPLPGSMVGLYEFTRLIKQHRERLVSKTLGAAQPGADALLRVPGNAATVSLLPSESPAR